MSSLSVVCALGLCLALALLPTTARAFYLPGVMPRDYGIADVVDLKVNKLDSVKTQLPYDYYSLGFCRPSDIHMAQENLGETLSGDRIENSPYEIFTMQVQACKVLCRMEYEPAKLAEFAERIGESYRINMVMDNLPAVTRYFTETDPDEDGKVQYTPHYEKGFALGFVGATDIPHTTEGVMYVNNHARLDVHYHAESNAAKTVRIVGFEVEPFSVKHEIDGEWDPENPSLKTCNDMKQVDHALMPHPVSGTNPPSEIIWTYDVAWHASDIKWSVRWDVYLRMTDPQIHWFSIVNSIMIVLFLTGMVALVLMRTLHRDLIQYNQLDDEEADAQQEETGWKLVHGEVFRPPPHGGLFSVLVGTGVQVMCCAVLTLTFALLGFLSPANRGGLMVALLLLFVFMGAFAGYVSTRIYVMFRLQDWKKNTLVTALFFPGVCFAVFFALNLLIWGEASSGAVPFVTLLKLLVLWFGISVPLVYLGSYFAARKPVADPPCPVNHIPRMVPGAIPWYMQPQFSVLVGGVLPFGAVFVELFFVLSSVWLHQFYYVFGFLYIVFIILIITCAEITIVLTYFSLCAEDYRWWWRSFLTAGSSALYLFLYSVLYFFTKLEITHFVSGLLYFGYMGLISFAFFIMTGTIGFFSTYVFVHRVYSMIKIS